MIHTLAAVLLLAAAPVAPAPVAPAPAKTETVEDAPAFPTAGYRRPELAVKNCVQNSVRLPRELKDRITGPITAKFAVGGGGEITRFELMTKGLPERVGQLIEQAVRGCKWNPGADGQGRAIPLWVILPLRFAR